MEPKINRKKILFVVTQSELGGAQRFIYELTTKLDKEKYEILVAGGADSKKLDHELGIRNFEFFEPLKEKGIQIKKLDFLKRKVNPWFDFLAFLQIRKIIRSWKPDIVFLNSSKAGTIGSLAAKTIIPNSKFKILYRIGGWSFNDPWPNWKKRLFILTEKITAKFKNIIVVNNKHDYDQAVKLKIKPKEKIVLIHNGIDALKMDLLPRDEARRKFKVSQSEFVIGAIANFYPTKGLEYLIEATKILKSIIPDSKFLIQIIGDGQERKSLESRIMNYGLGKNVILLSQIPEAQKYMKAFDIFVLPSVKEGFPWVILDAMAAKVPIIATRVGALPEIIENGENGILVEPKNPQQLAEAIKYLIENERARQEFAFQAHQTAFFKFPIEKMLRETEELFNSSEQL